MHFDCDVIFEFEVGNLRMFSPETSKSKQSNFFSNHYISIVLDPISNKTYKKGYQDVDFMSDICHQR